MIKAQTFYEVQEETGLIDGQGRHTIFAMLFDGELSPSGASTVTETVVMDLAARLGGDERAFLEEVLWVAHAQMGEDWLAERQKKWAEKAHLWTNFTDIGPVELED